MGYVVRGYTSYPPARAATIVVAARDATAWTREQADYVCDGTNDGAAINAAITALPVNGGHVLLTEGTFLIETPITWDKDGVWLQGQTWRKNTCLIPIADGVNPAALIQVGNTQDALYYRISDLALDASLSGHASTGKGILVRGNDGMLENVFAQGFGDSGVYLTRLGNAVWMNYLRNVYVNRCGFAGALKAGIVVADGVYDTVLDSVLAQGGTDPDHQTVDYGFFLGSCGGVDLKACHAWYSNVAGLCLYQCDTARVIGGAWENNKGRLGISGIGATQITIDGVSCYLNTGGDVSFTNCTDLNVIGSHLFSACGKNIVATGGNRHNIIGNTFSGATVKAVDCTVPNRNIAHNHGYVTESAGSFTIPTQALSVQVPHGLAGIPSRVQLTPTSDTGQKCYWVSAKEAATFTVTLDSPNGLPITFDWEAVVV